MCRALAGTDCRPTLLRRWAGRPQLKRDPLGSTITRSGPGMSSLLSVIIALGGASYAWRAYSSLYERQRRKSQASDPVADTWWRIVSVSVAAGLFTFVLGVLAAAFRGPGWLAIILVGVLVAAAAVALVGAATLWRRPAR